MKALFRRTFAVFLFAFAVSASAQDEGSEAGSVDSAPPPDSASDAAAPGSDAGILRDDGPAGRLRGDLGGAIEQMIALLEAGKHLEFLERFVDPDDKAKVLAQGKTLAQLAESFGQSKAPELLKVLRSLRSKIPQYTSDGETASFVLDASSGTSRGSIGFRRVNGAWVLRN